MAVCSQGVAQPSGRSSKADHLSTRWMRPVPHNYPTEGMRCRLNPADGGKANGGANAPDSGCQGFSPVFESLIAHAAGLAGQFEAELVLLHVFTARRISGGAHAETGMTVDEYALQLRAEMRYRIERLGGIGVPVQFDAVEGRSTPEQIIATAQTVKVDLIVIGTHSRTGLRRVVLGSVAEEVLRHAPCPLLVVPMAVEAQERPAGVAT